MPYNPGTFASYFQTPLGQALWQFLHEEANIIRMETATYLFRPALEPLSPILEERFGDEIFQDQYKRLTGHMVKHIMMTRGFLMDRSGIPITTKNNRFYSATRYKYNLDTFSSKKIN